MGEYEKAAAIAERAMQRYPEVSTHRLQLAISYAHLGRTKEAKRLYEKSLRGWGESKPDLAMWSAFLHFKYGKCADTVAEGLLKAGCPGQPSDFYKIYAENRLTGKEVREVYSGQKHIVFYGKDPILVNHIKDGKAKFDGFGRSFSGTWWIKDDMVCYSWDRPDIKGLSDCQDNYRNPEITPGSKIEYFAVADNGIWPFSIKKKNK